MSHFFKFVPVRRKGNEFEILPLNTNDDELEDALQCIFFL